MFEWKPGDRAHVITCGWCTLIRLEEVRSRDYSPPPPPQVPHRPWVVEWWDGKVGVIGEHHFSQPTYQSC